MTAGLYSSANEDGTAAATAEEGVVLDKGSAVYGNIEINSCSIVEPPCAHLIAGTTKPLKEHNI